MNPWAPYHKVHSYIYEDELKQLALPAHKPSPWAVEQFGGQSSFVDLSPPDTERRIDKHARLSYLEQLYEQWLIVRAYCCTDTQWSLDTIPFPGDVFTGVKHHHSPRTASQLTHYSEPQSELDSIFPLLARGTLTFTSNGCDHEVCEINGWNRYALLVVRSLTSASRHVACRYKIRSLQDDDIPWQPGWHAYYSFGEGSPRREYDLGYVRLPVQQYLLENILPLSARHGIQEPSKLCLGQFNFTRRPSTLRGNWTYADKRRQW